MSDRRKTVEEATDAALFRLGASEGGKARAKRLTPEQRSEIARRAAEARWADHDPQGVRRAQNVGALVIGDTVLDCAVLEDGTRVINQGTMLGALGRNASMGRRGGVAPFISATNLREAASPELIEQLQPVSYKIPGQRFPATGYPAETLPKVCNLYLAVREAGNLHDDQEAAAQAAEILVRSLAMVGIVALVDEATGYQAERARDELQRLLALYVAEDFRPWVKTFPDAFFEEVFRLHGWEYKPGNNKRPGYVGTIINTYIYDRLPEGVAEELQRVNPKNASGSRSRRHHQHLTVDTGNVALDRQIQTVTTLMQVSDNLDQFRTLFAKKFPDHQGRRALRLTVTADDQVEMLFDYVDDKPVLKVQT
jgi:hypothetical protein